MIKQRAEIIAVQTKKVIEQMNTLMGYLELVANDINQSKEEEAVIQGRIEDYRRREEYYQSAEVKLQEARDLQFSLKSEKEQIVLDRNLIEKEKEMDRERKVRLDALESKLLAKQQRLQSLIAD